ncbi:hypothetical protein BDV98DRAFT_594475 [Pterulicium gracile]|uniref:NmrA-like domain-containing protein n=1 Tax=Pterulicium gracile TaxID=1884261 RepID=A0A5C3QI92_9AGAR|nr:hypothetical protein BDV98DRAFT_594475 [Pterula gracilis]
MSNKINILFTGATGYLGGSILERLLSHPDFARFQITAIVRSPEKAEKLRTFGIDVAMGSHNDVDLVTDIAAKADVVFTVADCDDLGAARAILEGLKRRHEKTGKKSTLIHTSGTGALIDDANGAFTSDLIYDDIDPDQIETLPDSAIHRHVDLPVVQADREGYVNTYIVLPSVVYGLATGKLIDQGIQNPHSILLPHLIELGVKRGQAGVCGKGQNTWPHVHIDDMADFYIILFDAILAANPAPGHGREGYYFGENGHYLVYDLCKSVAVALAAHGVGTDEPTTFTEEEHKTEFLVPVLGSNAQCKASRGRALGWKPRYSEEDLFGSVKAEVDAILKKN